MFKKIICTSIATAIMASSSLAYAEKMTIGIQAPRGALKAKQKWTGIVDHLAAEMGVEFRVKPLSPSDTKKSASSGTSDYIIANPVLSAVILRDTSNKHLASLVKKSGDKFGGVILSKAGSGIKTLADVKGKKVMAFKVGKSAGAYVFQMYQLKEAGIAKTDLAKISEAKKQDDVVLAIKAGAADVGFVRTGVLENMAKEGKINISDFNIINKQESDFPQVLSTKLFPEWQLLAVGKGNGMGISDKFKAKALAITKDSAGAAKAKITGFKEPISLDELVKVLTDMKIKPFGQ